MPSSRNALATSRNFMRMFPRLVRAGTTLPRSIVRPSGSASRSSNPCRRPNSCGKSGCAINVEGRSFLLLRLCGPDQEIADHWGLQHVAQPLITVWLQVRVQSCANPEFPVSAEYPRLSAVWGGCNGQFAVSVG